MNIRVGQGYDSHALIEGRPLILGGVDWQESFGCLGHSDGDCLLHALTDAFLGAFALGDIGTFFPDDDPRWKGADSAELLKQVLERLPAYQLGNADITLFLNRPKFKPHREAVRNRLSELLNLDSGRISIKAKTWEGMGFDDVVSCSATIILEVL